MQIELKNSWKSGFNLTEKDFRRIVDLMIEKIITQPTDGVMKQIRYKLANGAILETASVDDLFNEENVGTRKIEAVEANMWVEGGMRAQIGYRDLTIATEEKNSISYKLLGEIRDPLFVLASELDERINQTKRLNLWFEGNKNFMMLFVTGGFALMLAILAIMASRSSTYSVLAAYEAGQFTQDMQGLFKFIAGIERARAERDLAFPAYFPFLGFVLIFIAAWLVSAFVKYFFYPFNFAWGEQAGVIAKRERNRNFIFVGIGLALIIGIVSSYLAGLVPKI